MSRVIIGVRMARIEDVDVHLITTGTGGGYIRDDFGLTIRNGANRWISIIKTRGAIKSPRPARDGLRICNIHRNGNPGIKQERCGAVRIARAKSDVERNTTGVIARIKRGALRIRGGVVKTGRRACA